MFLMFKIEGYVDWDMVIDVKGRNLVRVRVKASLPMFIRNLW